jgi:hypothetical protein
MVTARTTRPVVKVWTVQTPDVWETLRAGKVWRADTAHVDPAWLPAYRWMAHVMGARLGRPAEDGQMPIWCWHRWRGTRRPRPDLRHGGHLRRGSRGVRLEIEIAEERILRSDFELWHYVLNGWYLPRDTDDERAFDARPDRRRIEPSWHRIFDLTWRNRRYTASAAERSIQAVTWELRLTDIVDAVGFFAR